MPAHKDKFLELYNHSVDEVFSYYYQKTANRALSLRLTEQAFKRAWKNVAQKNRQDIIRDEMVSDSEPFKGTNILRFKAS
jgi:hypothetical protein